MPKKEDWENYELTEEQRKTMKQVQRVMTLGGCFISDERIEELTKRQLASGWEDNFEELLAKSRREGIPIGKLLRERAVARRAKDAT